MDEEGKGRGKYHHAWLLVNDTFLRSLKFFYEYLRFTILVMTIAVDTAAVVVAVTMTEVEGKLQ